MITLTPLPRASIARVQHLTLPPDQDAFVGPIDVMTSEPDTLQDFHAITSHNEVVGFFKIDRDFKRRIPRLPANAHGLRGLLIGGQYQKRGFGRAFLQALPAYLKVNYSKVSDVWLSVDIGNSVAIKAYRTAGWRTNGAQFQGRSGAEQVMRRAL